MAQPTAAGTAMATNANKMTRAVKSQWDKRSQQNRDKAPEQNVDSQIDDVFLVLALLGEALLPLGVFDEAQYSSTLADVHSAIASSGLPAMADMFKKLPTELQYLCTAGLTMCAVFAPMHVYRGFGACVYSEWDWGCPDLKYLEKKVKKETSMFSKMPDPQPNKQVLLAFDRVAQVLQVKSMSFLTSRPSISGFAEAQPRYGPRSDKEVKDSLDLCEDLGKNLDKRGHPSPPGTKIVSWGIPWAGWTSTFSCQLTKDWELVLLNQMDPGRLLHAFLCRGSLTLDEGQLLTLPPGSPAESLACWLAGLPTMRHKIITWDSFETAYFEKKVGKRMTAKLGQYPLPNKFVIRDAVAVVRPISPPGQITTSLLHRTVSPPPYSPARDARDPTSPADWSSVAELSNASTDTLELGDRDAAELEHRDVKPEIDSRPVTGGASSFPATPASSSANVIQKSTTVPARKPTPSAVSEHPTVTLPVRAQTEVLRSKDHIREDRSDSAPPPLPPKVLNDHDPVPVLYSPAGRSVEASAFDSPTDLGPHYLRLLQSVARGHITPQQVQEMFISGSIHSPLSSYLTAEPQELDSNPAPPKFMGVSIPRGEVRRQSGSNSLDQKFPLS